MSAKPWRERLRDVPWVWVGVVVLLLGGLGRQLWQSHRPSPLVGTPAPDVSMPLAASEGDRLRLQDLRGDVVLLEFWASWCGACRETTPALNALSERYGGRGVRVIGVNVDARDEREVAAGMRAFHARYPSALDADGLAQAAYGVEVLPTLVLIDREGVVRRVGRGFSNERAWAGYITDLL